MGRVTVETDTPEKKFSTDTKILIVALPIITMNFLVLKKTLLLLNFWRDFYGEPYM